MPVRSDITKYEKSPRDIGFCGAISSEPAWAELLTIHRQVLCIETTRSLARSISRQQSEILKKHPLAGVYGSYE